jgi:hypothetical protein
LAQSPIARYYLQQSVALARLSLGRINFRYNKPRHFNDNFNAAVYNYTLIKTQFAVDSSDSDTDGLKQPKIKLRHTVRALCMAQACDIR